MISEGVFINDCLQSLVGVAFGKKFRLYCHRVSVCEDCVYELRRYGKNVAWIDSNPEATPVQFRVAPKQCWPELNIVE